jgi:multidrug transporter EmrE-like cation transporter
VFVSSSSASRITIARVGCIALIVCGILGLKLLGGESAA